MFYLRIPLMPLMSDMGFLIPVTAFIILRASSNCLISLLTSWMFENR